MTDDMNTTPVDPATDAPATDMPEVAPTEAPVVEPMATPDAESAMPEETPTAE